MEETTQYPLSDEAGSAGRLLWPALALLLLVLLAGVLFLWWMAQPPGEGSAEVTFARDMSAHHAQAVEMALILQARTEDVDLRLFAQDLLLTQQAQIGQMQGWLQSWQRPLTGNGPPMAGNGADMGMASRAEVQALHDLPTAEAETRFLQLMVRHHLGGLHMAEAVLAADPRPEVARLAQAMIDGQQGEVVYMEELLAQRGAAVLPFHASARDEHRH